MNLQQLLTQLQAEKQYHIVIIHKVICHLNSLAMVLLDGKMLKVIFNTQRTVVQHGQHLMALPLVQQQVMKYGLREALQEDAEEVVKHALLNSIQVDISLQVEIFNRFVVLIICYKIIILLIYFQNALFLT